MEFKLAPKGKRLSSRPRSPRLRAMTCGRAGAQPSLSLAYHVSQGLAKPCPQCCPLPSGHAHRFLTGRAIARQRRVVRGTGAPGTRPRSQAARSGS